MLKPLMASPNYTVTQTDQNFKYKGVRKRKWGKWVSEIRLPNSRERIWLGSYDSAEKAARAFDAALFCLRGGRANFNFPDTPFHFHLPPHLHDHQSLTPHQIQLLASSFAKQPHPQQLDPPHEEPSAEFHSSTVSVTETASSVSSASSSCMEVDHGDDSRIDWSFLNLLDSNDDLGATDCGLYSELDNFQFGEFELCLTPSDVPFDYINAQEENQSEDAFSHHSFLWNFGYDCL